MSSEVAAEDTARLGVPGNASASTSGGRDGERVGGNASERAGTRRRGGTRDGASGRERERQRGREKDRDVGRERDRKKEREEAVVRERPGPKRLVIRRLPPGLTQAAFHEAMASCPCQLGSVRFVPGLEGKGYMGDRYVAFWDALSWLFRLSLHSPLAHESHGWFGFSVCFSTRQSRVRHPGCTRR